MKFKHFLRRLLRFLFAIVLLLLSCVVAYIALPSIAPSNKFVSGRLNGGRTVTRLYEASKFFIEDQRNPVSISEFLRHDSEYFSLDFQLRRTLDNNVTLQLRGGTESPLAWLPWVVYLTSLTETEVPLSFQGDKPTVSEPMVVSVPYYAWFWDEWDVAFPWFQRADFSLIQWWIYPHVSVNLPLRIRHLPSDRLIEIWPETPWWELTSNNKSIPDGAQPLVSISIPEVGSITPLAFTFPDYPISASPTPYTYHLRLALLALLIPASYLGLLFLLAAFVPYVYYSAIINFFMNLLSFSVVIMTLVLLLRWLGTEAGRSGESTAIRVKYEDYGSMDSSARRAMPDPPTHPEHSSTRKID